MWTISSSSATTCSINVVDMHMYYTHVPKLEFGKWTDLGHSYVLVSGCDTAPAPSDRLSYDVLHTVLVLWSLRPHTSLKSSGLWKISRNSLCYDTNSDQNNIPTTSSHTNTEKSLLALYAFNSLYISRTNYRCTYTMIKCN